MAKLIVTHLNHDLENKRTFVSFVWSDDATKRLGLEVPFGTAIADAEEQAILAVRSLATELLKADVAMP